VNRGLKGRGGEGGRLIGDCVGGGQRENDG